MADKVIMILNVVLLAVSAVMLILTTRIYRQTAARAEQLEKYAERLSKAAREATGRPQAVVMRMRIPKNENTLDEFQLERFRLHVMEEDDLPDFPNGI